MARRLTAAEKGKGLASDHAEPQVKRIRAPSLDTSALIEDNSLTLIGRLTNPQEQRIRTLITSLPRKWNIQGDVVGSDLGHNCFQFRFEKEEDLRDVLDNRPYHFGYWMVIIQRWEPIISETFPSLIRLWVRIKGLPLHFWHETMVCNIGKELGTYEKYELTKTSWSMSVWKITAPSASASPTEARYALLTTSVNEWTAMGEDMEKESAPDIPETLHR